MAAVQVINARCFLRYQHCNVRQGDEVIPSAISNGPYGATVGVFQEDDGPAGGGQSYLRMIGTLDQRDAERINHVARPQLAGGFRPRGGPRIGRRFCPDIQSTTISPFSPQYVNAYPPNYGVLPAGPPAAGSRKPYVTKAVVCPVFSYSTFQNTRMEDNASVSASATARELAEQFRADQERKTNPEQSKRQKKCLTAEARPSSRHSQLIFYSQGITFQGHLFH